jgi:hypothetical protein
MEFIHGLKISDLDGMKKMGLDIKDVGLMFFNNKSEFCHLLMV